MCVSTAVHVDDQQTTVYVYLQEQKQNTWTWTCDIVTFHTTQMVNAIQKAVSTIQKAVLNYSGLYRSEGSLYRIVQKPVDIVQSSDGDCI